jgi:trigger factor
VLDALAEKEELTVEQEELTEHLLRRAQQSGVAPQEFANSIVQSGQIGVIFSEVRRGKALAQLLESVKITDESGNVVDLSQLDEDEDAGEAIEGFDELDEDGHDEDPEHPHEHPREEQYEPEVSQAAEAQAPATE